MKILQKKELAERLKIIQFPYNLYLQWLDDEICADEFHVVSVSDTEVRDVKAWNILGREIYDEEKLLRFTNKILLLLAQIESKNFIIQHEYQPAPWFPKAFFNKLNNHFLAKFLQLKTLLPKFHIFDGGFEANDDIGAFLSLFIDYPFLFKYKSIDCFSLDEPMVMKITHHLDVQFISQNVTSLKNLMNFCAKIGFASISIR